ncbi:hypothetical protein DENSPDRAFT_830708 [Dentipellis sp. KUC8613]|nr:hypothetical protein DENSPDRAFT_830708 [Dentipellis sp. KUC8613]
MMGGPDLLALLYWALSMMQKTLRPFAQGRNFYLTQMVGDRPPDYSLLPQGRRDFPTPTIHLTITLAGASVGLWGVFIIGRFLSAL